MTAALRAACAWSLRTQHAGALREVGRMVGVVMEVAGPGRGVKAPLELIAAARAPLGELLEQVGLLECDPAVRDLPLLDDADELTDFAYDVAVEYARPLMPMLESAEWLPAWTRQRAEQIENDAFRSLVSTGKPAAYTAARRFLVENPAGRRTEITDRLSRLGVVLKYETLDRRQIYRDGDHEWWWPCPVCRWPMAVEGRYLRCRYARHAARFQLQPGAKRPRLLRVGDGATRAVSTAEPAADVVMVPDAVWRFIVVPGATELRLCRELEALGASVELWPDMDTYDLHVSAGDLVLRLDVKERTSVRALIDDLRKRPPRADVLLPQPLAHQAENISGAGLALIVRTERDVKKAVRRALRRS
ncbi:hypothetical protein ABZX12_41110 [Kribbella sp. NPDC003505]|uniref:restriction endonuclease-related protein n=1 Tax=Kribbella sp. NPDC003505 TaxID=3154448 RepID=UPI0033B79580